MKHRKRQRNRPPGRHRDGKKMRGTVLLLAYNIM